MKTFLMVWNAAQTQVLQQQILTHLDSKPAVKNYFVPFLGTILIVTDHTMNASSLSWLVHTPFPNLVFAVTPVEEPLNTNGWMPKVFWDLLYHPKPSGRWP